MSMTVLRLHGARRGLTLDLSQMHPLSPILRADYAGKTYLGFNHWNPGSFDEGSGACLEQRATGVDLLFLLRTYLGRTNTMLALSDPSDWTAWFDLRMFEPREGSLVVRLHFASPMTTAARVFFEQDIELQEFAPY